MSGSIADFLKQSMRKGGRYVPARLQAALALLERVREFPSLDLADHKAPNSSGLISHETFGNRAHERLNLEVINKNHGRRSCNVGGWGQELLDLLREGGFADAPPGTQSEVVGALQSEIGAVLRNILEAEPLKAKIKGRSAEAVIRDVLAQAEERGKAGDVAQYLVGAKLMLRLGREIPVIPSNKGDRKSRGDLEARTGDYEIENTTIEVAVGLPDEKHLAQVAEALEDTDLEVWLVTRHDRVAIWRNELSAFEGVDPKRVVVLAVDAFVGQNMSEMGGFSATGKAQQLQELFRLYNQRWVAGVGTPGICIAIS